MKECESKFKQNEHKRNRKSDLRLVPALMKQRFLKTPDPEIDIKCTLKNTAWSKSYENIVIIQDFQFHEWQTSTKSRHPLRSEVKKTDTKEQCVAKCGKENNWRKSQRTVCIYQITTSRVKKNGQKAKTRKEMQNPENAGGNRVIWVKKTEI